MTNKKYEYKPALGRLFTVAFVTGAAALLYITTPAGAAEFTDVDNSYWAAEDIQWAENEGLIHGYDDGSFHPGDDMIEAQFSVMLTRYFDMESGTPSDLQHWAQPAYVTLSEYELRMPGLRDNAVKNRAVTRGTVAKVIAQSQAHEPGLKEAVAWMFEEDLTTGRQDGETQTERFDVNGKLTRAQAAVFFKRIDDSGHSVWRAEQMLDLTSEGSNQYTEMVRPLYREAGVTLYARNDNSFGTADQEYYHLFQAYQGEMREFAVARTSRANFDLAAQAAAKLGAPADAKRILEGLVEADASGSAQTAGQVEITPRPSDVFLVWNEQQ
ncbi:S-layer homology domain-containing protein [Salibacterium qingdaonense]|uniref:S-layer homology domain-containing protein n=1 Tax=Salibacterium qingdaonense TaxID=266892 RepID=A0A1I4L314_9BACI|nr:S-layer homology domain-containing protein [Salibacterium qingdaonense]SFL85266.1 S-layer homology domain-containing protein [Salibacterium qingdaonense]